MSEQTTEFDQIVENLSNPLNEAKARFWRGLGAGVHLAILVSIIPLTYKLWSWAF